MQSAYSNFSKNAKGRKSSISFARKAVLALLLSAALCVGVIPAHADTDTAAPVLTHTLSSEGWTKTGVTVNLSVTDNGGSGVSQVAYKRATDDVYTVLWSGSQDAVETSFSTTANGAYKVRLVDVAGNDDVRDVIISTIDRTAPTFSSVKTPGGWTAEDVTVTISATDAGGSGVNKIWYKVPGATDFTLLWSNDDPANNHPTSQAASFIAEERGRYRVKIADVAGNEYTGSVQISNIDRTVPDTPDVYVTNTSGDDLVEINGRKWSNEDVMVHIREAEQIATSFLTFSSPNAFTLSSAAGERTWDGILEYSTNLTSWTAWDGTTSIGSSSDATHVLYVRGTGNTVITGAGETVNWVLDGSNIECSGNIEYLLDYNTAATGEHPAMGDKAFRMLFKGCSALTSAPELPAEEMTESCYAGLFYDCVNLDEAPELPATTLAPYCYNSMFRGCTGLTMAPELNAATMAAYCYQAMFYQCTGLIAPPALPATTLAEGCYQGIFFGCSNMVDAPELPATTLAERCYARMFEGCNSLAEAPELSVTTLAPYCYEYMFSECASLTIAPELPATTLAQSCYSYMFEGCTSLATSPELPATTLTSNCYESMFEGCTSLTTAPELSATTLVSDCYSSMFSNCTSLTTVPELPATTLAPYCYYYMFCGCTSLTTPPELPATTLAQYCYKFMLRDCTSLKLSATKTNEYGIPYRVPVSGDGVTASNALAGMFHSTGGTFTGSPEINRTYYLWGRDPADTAIKFSSDNTFTLATANGAKNWDGTLEYSTDLKNWTTWDGTTTLNSSDGAEHVLYVRGTGNTVISGGSGKGWTLTGSNISCSGNIENLLNHETVTAGEHPSMGKSCYSYMFRDCTSLTTAPELPATTLAGGCYERMFSGCTSLATAPELPATTLAGGCYYYMFSGCTSLTTAPELPATTLASSCYGYMFQQCTDLITPPALPATTLASSCYGYMFQQCTDLITPPALPATTLAVSCYTSMFNGCTSLATAPELPATTLADQCYRSMFQDCTSLTAAPELPATTLANSCYANMFYGCTSLTTAPELPATTLANYCYQYMFYNCTSLTTAPELPATTLRNYCYSYMFFGCTGIKLSDTKTNEYGIPYRVPISGNGVTASSALSSMFSSTGGTFRGTPVINRTYYLWGRDPADTAIKFSSDNAFTLATANGAKNWNGFLEYSTDLKNWTTWDGTTTLNSSDGAAHVLYVRGTGNTVISGGSGKGWTLTGSNISCSGNIENLLNHETVTAGEHPSMGESCYRMLFYGCTSLTTAPELPATTLANSCYRYMFNGCTSLTTAPELPATTLTQRCYEFMFYNCTSLTEAPELPATTLVSYCYNGMFRGCTSLTTAPELPATTMANTCYGYMFNGCTSLTTAPELPVTTLAQFCYDHMFYNCTSLTTAPELPATTLRNYCYQSMFSGCTSLTTAPELPATTLASFCYSNMFSGCTSLTTAPELPATTLASNCYFGMFSGCTGIKLSATKTNEYGIPYRVPVSGNGTDATNALLSMFDSTGGTFTGTPEINRTYYLWGRDPADTAIKFSSNNAFTLATANGAQNWDGTLEYSTDLKNWTTWDGTTTLNSSDGTKHVLYVRGTDNSYITGGYGKGWTLTGSKISCSGNIENLLNHETVTAGGHPNMGESCYGYLFYNCTSLTTPPELPTTTLTESCYEYMFRGCTSLTSAPELPAIALADCCYDDMFRGCTSLTTAPELPATTLAMYCYSHMFDGCTSLTTAPELPATTLADGCYWYMFSGCTSLTSAPELPAIALADYCYDDMFRGCTSLTTAPELPATTLADYCYDDMFRGCTSLTTAPELPATTLVSYCYQSMFNGCTSLTTPPELPATTPRNYCYSSMFQGCTSLTMPPELPATTLAQYCYCDMFSGCTSLATAPELPATTLAEGCYQGMFNGCTSLKLSTTKSGAYTIPYRVPVSGDGVMATGALSNMFGGTGGTFAGTPSINTTYYLYDPEYIAALKFSSPNEFTLATKNSTKNWNGTLEYSTDLDTWNTWDGTTTLNSSAVTYFDEAELAVPRGGTLDWNEADRGNISILANDIDTLELSNLPDIEGYRVNHSLGGDISVERNDGTFFPDVWELPGGTVTMPTIDTYYASISVSAPVGTTIEVAGNTHTFDSADVWSVNVDFGEYVLSASYVDQGETLTYTDTVTVDSYSDYHFDVSVTPGGFDVTFGVYGGFGPDAWGNFYSAYSINGTRYYPDSGFSGSVPAGTVIDFIHGNFADTSTCVYVNNSLVANMSEIHSTYSYTVSSDISVQIFRGSGTGIFRFYISTSSGGQAVGSIDGECTVTLNPVTSIPVTTISRLYRPADSTTWVAFDSAGEQHSFTAASNLALNRSFASYSYSGTDLRNLSNFPSGSWTVNWNGDSEYITVHFEEYADAEHVLYVRGTGNTVISGGCYDLDNEHGSDYGWTFTGTDISCSGSIENLLDYATVIAGGHPSMGDYCFDALFVNCANLTVAPELPATVLTKHCYHDMFVRCTNLTTAPELPATTLAEKCYTSLFNGCTSLTTVPELPATTLATSCYSFMFYGCTSLITPPELPATTLADWCYWSMFKGCTSLTTAPELPATTLAENCYDNMFYDCTSLKLSTTKTGAYTIPYRVPKAGSGTSATNALYQMFTGTGGTFTGTPSINTTYYLWDHELEAATLKFSSPSSFSLTTANGAQNWDGTLQYSTDLTSWSTWSGTTTLNAVKNGSEYLLYLRGTGNTVISGGDGKGWTLTGSNISCSGNIENLLNYEAVTAGEHPSMGEYCYSYLFSNCANLTIAPELPATTLADWCYWNMFYGCTSLTTAPELPAATLAAGCYKGMFYGCTSLTAAPELPATTLAENCYYSMFCGCTNLTTAPELPATTLAEYCYYCMFSDCTSLTSAPDELPATTLANSCYRGMFQNCTSLTSAPELPATTLSEYCYRAMFYNCTSLTTAPELPATTLSEYCYRAMFYNCTSLTTAPELPATTLSSGCYTWMFENCTSLTTAPELPATTLAQECYRSMFHGCTSLTTAPELPATTMAEDCYAWMFEDCTSLTTAPELPATTLAQECYRGMFMGCTSLTTAPELPTTTLASYCYSGMFQGCTSLTSAPDELPATTLAENCYYSMFYNCTNLATAPELPATTLAENCYYGMFWGCTSLSMAPELPATTLAENCYYGMFWGCTSLSMAPELPATTLAQECYRGMFEGCTSLTSAPELPATTLAQECYRNMFYKCTGIKLSTTETGAYTIPYRVPSVGDGTTATDALLDMFAGTGGTFAGTPSINTTYYLYDPEYIAALKFSSPNAFTLATANAKKNWDGTLEYSTDLNTWNTWDGATTLNSSNDAEHVLYVRGTGNSRITGSNSGPDTEGDVKAWVLGGTDISCSGNIENLLDYATVTSGNHPTMGASAAEFLFYACAGLTSAEKLELPTTTLTNYCYCGMFSGCVNLVAVPELPATTLAKGCYSDMFRSCTSLTVTPELPATTVADYCYSNMFWGCTNLKSAPAILPATTLQYCCYSSMFRECTSLTTLPELPATTLTVACYDQMFKDCTSIKLSTTKTGAYTIPYRVPKSGSGTYTTNSLYLTFGGTGGTFTGTPSINTTYYLWDYELEAATLKFSSPSSFSLKTVNGYKNWDGTLQYSTNLTSWTAWSGTTTLNAAQNGSEYLLYLRGTGNSVISGEGVEVVDQGWRLTGSNISCSGNVESLLNYETVAAGEHPSMGDYCYACLFADCTSLASAPELPATTLTDGCYEYMFYGCTSLTTPPELPATTLTEWCYDGMFEGCTGLTTAPELPATTLAIYCYSDMFSGCTSLTTAPELPATTLAEYCYESMFEGCTSLKLSATEAGAYTIPYRVPSVGDGTTANYALRDMFTGTGGTFTGTPSINTTYYLLNPEARTAIKFSSPSAFTLATTNSKKNWNGTLQYSTDLNTWNTWDGTTTLNSSADAEHVLYVRGTGNTVISGGNGKGWTLTGSNISCSGNIENLLNHETVTAGEHPSMGANCYNCMFEGCTSLTTTPELPATTLAERCYYQMFCGCTGLTTAPELPATTLTEWCYCNMFRDCTSLKLSTTKTGAYTIPYRVPSVGDGITAAYALTNMFTETGGTFTGTPRINTTYYLAG